MLSSEGWCSKHIACSSSFANELFAFAGMELIPARMVWALPRVGARPMRVWPCMRECTRVEWALPKPVLAALRGAMEVCYDGKRKRVAAAYYNNRYSRLERQSRYHAGVYGPRARGPAEAHVSGAGGAAGEGRAAVWSSRGHLGAWLPCVRARPERDDRAEAEEEAEDADAEWEAAEKEKEKRNAENGGSCAANAAAGSQQR